MKFWVRCVCCAVVCGAAGGVPQLKMGVAKAGASQTQHAKETEYILSFAYLRYRLIGGANGKMHLLILLTRLESVAIPTIYT